MFLFKNGYCQQYCKIMLACNQKAAPAEIPAAEHWSPHCDCSISLPFSTTGKNLANLIYTQTHTYSYTLAANVLSPCVLNIGILLKAVSGMFFFQNYSGSTFSFTP